MNQKSQETLETHKQEVVQPFHESQTSRAANAQGLGKSNACIFKFRIFILQELSRINLFLCRHIFWTWILKCFWCWSL
jgi:hypothetical protein